jgi:YidC/Oxa1 family membrane protein insertase
LNRRTKLLFSLGFVLLLLLVSAALARVEFQLQTIHAGELRELERFAVNCDQPGASFWCENRTETLQLVTAKGIDILFNEAGEIVALYSKQQKGMDFNRNYNLNDGQNLIPAVSPLPGGAILIDGEYRVPEDASAEWRMVSDVEIQGSFAYRSGDYAVSKTVSVYFTRQTMDVTATVQREGPEAAEEVEVRYLIPGLAREGNPIMKIGQANQVFRNLIGQPIQSPNYLAIQSSDSRGHAIIMRPVAAEAELHGLLSPAREIAMVKTLAPTEESVGFNLQIYGGRNELIRFHQESYLGLPELFQPNLLGQLSLVLIRVLEAIYSVVASWGLSIIVLTLLIRMLIWPLVTTQTKSMVGMQQIQPKMQALQKKYKDNREKLTQEMMKLYKEAGVNPAGGCLPIFMQMPIFIMLWQVFMNYEFAEGFLWIPDLGLYDPTYILPILYVGVMVGYSFLMAKGNPQSLRMQLMINLVFIFFIIRFPAGVTLYWVASMLVQVGQHYLIQRQMAQAVPVKAKPQG